MAWETRSGRRYYYTARKENGRVIKEYVGTGLIASLAAELDMATRAERQAERQKQRQKRRQEDAFEQAVAAFDRDVTAVLSVALTAAGYHRHKRGEWRKRRYEHQDS